MNLRGSAEICLSEGGAAPRLTVTADWAGNQRLHGESVRYGKKVSLSLKEQYIRDLEP